MDREALAERKTGRKRHRRPLSWVYQASPLFLRLRIFISIPLAAQWVQSRPGSAWRLSIWRNSKPRLYYAIWGAQGMPTTPKLRKPREPPVAKMATQITELSSPPYLPITELCSPSPFWDLQSGSNFATMVQRTNSPVFGHRIGNNDMACVGLMQNGAPART